MAAHPEIQAAQTLLTRTKLAVDDTSPLSALTWAPRETGKAYFLPRPLLEQGDSRTGLGAHFGTFLPWDVDEFSAALTRRAARLKELLKAELAGEPSLAFTFVGTWSISVDQTHGRISDLPHVTGPFTSLWSDGVEPNRAGSSEPALVVDLAGRDDGRWPVAGPRVTGAVAASGDTIPARTQSLTTIRWHGRLNLRVRRPEWLAREYAEALIRLVDGILAALRVAVARLLAALSRMVDVVGFLVVMVAVSMRHRHRHEPPVEPSTARFHEMAGMALGAC